MQRLGKILKLPRLASGARQFSAANAKPSADHAQSNAERFEPMRDRRRAEAKRTVVVEIESPALSNNVYNYCKQFGDINAAIAYTPRDGRNFVLLEYGNVDGFNEAMGQVSFKPNAVQWPLQFLRLRASKLHGYSADGPVQASYTRTPPNIVSILQEATCIEDQIDLLHRNTRITDVSTRLRFLATYQIERVLNHFLNRMIPKARILPFGSTMNGFGKLSSDLDVALAFDEGELACDTSNADKPLQFHGKHIGAEDKILSGRRIKCIAAAIKYCIPGAERINAIHRAKVPIVGFFDKNIHCNVDLSITNPSGFYATNVLYELGVLDARVQPLVFLIRRWANEFEVTKSRATDTFSNFHLTYMALSFLQKLQQPILPALDELPLENASFVFDRDRMSFATTNTSSVQQLFEQFLEHYIQFDATKYKVSLLTRELCPKVEPGALELQNVYEPAESWGGNISTAEYDTMKIMARETLSEMRQHRPTKVAAERWGILELLTHLK